MQLRILKKNICSVVFIPFVYIYADLAFCQIQNPTLEDEATESVTRFRVSTVMSRFAVNNSSFIGYGPEFGIERSLAPKWLVTGGIGQAYSAKEQFRSLYTSLDVGIFYSLTGKFTQLNKIWRDHGYAVGKFSEYRTGGLRVGIETQQYYFNTSTGLIPFSGIAGKMNYELGLNGPYDLAIGVDVGTLGNADLRATCTRGLIIFLFNL